MPLPFLIAGAAALAGATVAETAAVGVAAAVLTSDKKKEPTTKTTREQISASDVPDDIRRQVEGSRQVESQNNSQADIYYRMANEFYYGLKGINVNHQVARGLYKKAADAGHEGARRQLHSLIFQY